MWQAIRGNGKRAQTLVTTAESPGLSPGKRAIAVSLVDVFGNDASATKELLRQYYNANKLMVDCLNSGCVVSPKMREIGETLLLSIAEIESPNHER